MAQPILVGKSRVLVGTGGTGAVKWKCGAFPSELFVRDDLAEDCNTLLDSGDLHGPCASGTVGIGNPGSVFALCFGEMFEQDLELLLQSGAWHKKRLAPEASPDSGIRHGKRFLWRVMREHIIVSFGRDMASIAGFDGCFACRFAVGELSKSPASRRGVFF